MTRPPADDVAWGVVLGRLAGHGLLAGGGAFTADGTQAEPPGAYVYRGGPGHGKCSCGELSELLPSAYARRKWHWQHKQAVYDAAHPA